MYGQPRCKHVKADGTTCGATATAGGTWCWFHDPDPVAQAQRDEARRRGGQETRRRRLKAAAFTPSIPPALADLPLAKVEEVTAALADTFNRVRRGDLDVRVGNCLGLLAGQLLRAIRGEAEIAVTVKPQRIEPIKLTDEKIEEILAKARASMAQRGLTPLPPNPPPAIGLKEAPPAPAPQANGDAPHSG
jgi:hypothetical protein